MVLRSIGSVADLRLEVLGREFGHVWDWDCVFGRYWFAFDDYVLVIKMRFVRCGNDGVEDVELLDVLKWS